MYSLLLESYVKDPQEKDKLFRAIQTVDCVKRKADWAIKWITRCVHSARYNTTKCIRWGRGGGRARAGAGAGEELERTSN